MANPPAGLTEYIERIQDLANSANPSLLLAHSYVRYLGDLSGGQNMRHILGKAYDLQDDRGLSFYVFKELKSPKPASLGEMKRIKDWFRAGMDTGGKAVPEELKGELTTTLVPIHSANTRKGELAEEAKKVFYLNAGIFNAIRVEPPASKVVFDARKDTSSSWPWGDRAISLSSVIPVVAASK